MADSRILHRAAGDSEKVAALSDLEYRVWTQYILSADDFGVMPALAYVLQADNRSLRQRPTKTIQKALEAVIAAGLVLTFTHQGERYLWQSDWQDRQSLKHPRQTFKPIPNDLRSATPKTLKLFQDFHPTLQQDSEKVSETFPPLACAGERETLTQTQTPAPPGELERGAGKTKRIDYPEDFETAWRAYPLKTGKGDAYAAWKKAQPDLAVVLDALRWQVNQPKWAEERGKYIPHFSTWLNQSRWDDEPFHAPDPTDQAFAMVEDLFQRKASGQ